MTGPPGQPCLYQANTRVWLNRLAGSLGRPATLDDIADGELDRLAALGFDWLWLLSVWQTGPAARAISRTNPGWRREFAAILPDLRDEDIAGSGFAIQSYTVARELGGDAALARLRRRLAQRGVSLMLDFVPNHMAPDHPWVEQHPDYFVHGSEADLARAPANYRRVQTGNGPLVLAYGRDPYFDGWPDTLQLNYGNPALQQAMMAELERIAGQCDGLRCDMAMLLLPEVFQRTWGIPAAPFWPRAISAVRQGQPGFRFMAEVYWDLEWTLQQQGFDYAYDKRLYDRLRAGQARSVRQHLQAGLDYQDRLARFLENHDEPRVAAVLPLAQHRAAAVITFLAPGLRLFHQGQLTGWRVRIPTHLVRGPVEATDPAIAGFYGQLLGCLRDPAFREDDWQLLEPCSAWTGNGSHDDFVAFARSGPGGRRRLVAVNYAGHPGQCYLRLPWDDLAGRPWRLQDRLGPAVYDRDGDELAARGLYLDLPAWGCHVFQVGPVPG